MAEPARPLICDLQGRTATIASEVDHGDFPSGLVIAFSVSSPHNSDGWQKR
jgi:hypothetical protein